MAGGLLDSSDRGENFDIWAQPLGEGNPIQITSGSARLQQPSWSPDGRYIAYRSSAMVVDCSSCPLSAVLIAG